MMRSRRSVSNCASCRLRRRASSPLSRRLAAQLDLRKCAGPTCWKAEPIATYIRANSRHTSRRRSSFMSDSDPFDLLLCGGYVICPASGLNGVMDVAIRDGWIAVVQPNILPASAKEVVDVSGRLVLPGMIDTHAHVYKYVSGRFGLNADMVGVQSGVTTVIDQGGPSCMTFPGFRKFIAEQATTNVLAFLSAYVVGGLEGHYYPSLYGPDGVDVKATVQVAEANRDIVKGIKAHAEIGGYLRWGNAVMKLAKEISRETR